MTQNKSTISSLIIIVTLVIWNTAWANNENSGKQENIKIYSNVIVMPANRFVLVRDNNKYCAIKFLRFWKSKKSNRDFAEYIRYYQQNVIDLFTEATSKQDILKRPRTFGIGRLQIGFDKNMEIDCQEIKLFWGSNGSVYFHSFTQKGGEDYGIEIAPTIWKKINDIDISDKRIKWYKFDKDRKEKNVMINELWNSDNK
jgi:hypothetical protein